MKILIILSMCIIGTAQAHDIPDTYECVVSETHARDDNAIIRSFKNAILIFDAANGLLDARLFLLGDHEPPFRLVSRLKVQNLPSQSNNLHAAHYRPSVGADSKPGVAWLMLETLENPIEPDFMFFSTGVRGLLTGKCKHESNEITQGYLPESGLIETNV